MRLFKTKGNEMVELAVLGKGDYAGLISYLLGERFYYLNAEAMDTVELINVTTHVEENRAAFKDSMFFRQWTNFLSKSLKKSYEMVKALAYFEKIHYDHYKKGQVQLYHIKDFTRISTLLMLMFNRYNYVVSKNFFEDIVYTVLPRVSMRLSDVINVLERFQFICSDESRTGDVVYSLINTQKLELLNSYLRRNLLVDPKQLLLTLNQYGCLSVMLHLMLSEWEDFEKLKEVLYENLYKKVKSTDKNTEESLEWLNKIFDTLQVSLPASLREGRFTFTKDDLQKAYQELGEGAQTSIPLEGLQEKGLLRQELDEKGNALYNIAKVELIDIIVFQRIIKALGSAAVGGGQGGMV